jgi:hypothetical protein
MGQFAPMDIQIAEANNTRWAPVIGLVVVVVFCLASWFLAPKGENQTYVHRAITATSSNFASRYHTSTPLYLGLANRAVYWASPDKLDMRVSCA